MNSHVFYTIIYHTEFFVNFWYIPKFTQILDQAEDLMQN